MPKTTETPNMFAGFNDLMMLDYAYLGAVSPENLSQDGQRSIEAQTALLKRIQRDYGDKRAQLLQG